MLLKALSFAPALALLALLAGCGGGTPAVQPAAAKPKPKLVIEPNQPAMKPPEPAVPEKPLPPQEPAPPEAAVPGKSMGISQAAIMKGLETDIPVSSADMPSKEGDIYMGYTADAEDKNATLILYGSEKDVSHAWIAVNLALAEFPEVDKYPDYMKRNLRLCDTLLTNIFGSPLPEELKAGLEYAKTYPSRAKWVKLNGKLAMFVYDPKEKKLKVDVK